MTTDTGANVEWRAWLNSAMRAAGFNPDKDGPKLDALTNGAVTPSMRSNWKNRGGVSPTAVIEIANALRADLLEGLRAAGHGAMAQGIVTGVAGSTAPRRDRIEARIDDDPGLAEDERKRWRALYRAEIEAVRDRYDATLDRAGVQPRSAPPESKR